jgi:hypothetical protein
MVQHRLKQFPGLVVKRDPRVAAHPLMTKVDVQRR